MGLVRPLVHPRPTRTVLRSRRTAGPEPEGPIPPMRLPPSAFLPVVALGLSTVLVPGAAHAAAPGDLALHAQVCASDQNRPAAADLNPTAHRQTRLTFGSTTAVVHEVSYDIEGADRVCDLVYLTADVAAGPWPVAYGAAAAPGHHVRRRPRRVRHVGLRGQVGGGFGTLGTDPDFFVHPDKGTVLLPGGMFLMVAENYQPAVMTTAPDTADVPALYRGRTYTETRTLEWEVSVAREEAGTAATEPSASVVAAATRNRDDRLSTAVVAHNAARSSAAASLAAATATAAGDVKSSMRSARRARAKSLTLARKAAVSAGTTQAKRKATKQITRAKTVYTRAVKAATVAATASKAAAQRTYDDRLTAAAHSYALDVNRATDAFTKAIATVPATNDVVHPAQQASGMFGHA